VTRQLSLAESQQRQRLLDPWTEERKCHPGRAIMRVIDLTLDVQVFMPLHPIPAREDEAALSLDGTTRIVHGYGRALTTAEEAAIIQEWDDVWRAQQ
jgi:hypothetical protein